MSSWGALVSVGNTHRPPGAGSPDTEDTTGLLEGSSPLQDLLSVLERVWEGSFMVVLKLIRSGRRR